MPALEHRRDAARARDPRLELIGLDRVGRRGVVGVGEPGAHLLPQRARLLLGALGEIGARRLVEHRREAVRRQPPERRRQIVDRIVGARAAAVPALVARGEVIGLEDLLGGLQPEAERPPVLGEGPAPGVGVERIFGVEQVAPLGRAEPRAIALGLLVAGVEDDDVAGRLEPRLAQLDQRRGGGDHALLVVARPAAVEIAVLFDEGERVFLPLGALGLDHVHVREDQDRLCRPTRCPSSARPSTRSCHRRGRHGA